MRVLVTRPEPGAARTAAKLAEMGHRPVILPLSRIVPLPAAMPAGKAGDGVSVEADAVAVTSANAIRQASPALIAAIRRLHVYAVGPATAAATREAGFESVTSIDGDARQLAREILRNDIRKVLYLAGRVRHAGLEEALADAGVSIEAIETYDTIDAPNPVEALKSVCAREPVQAVLVYSANTARLVNTLLDDLYGHDMLGNSVFCCISWRVAEMLRLSATSRVQVSEGQNEPSLLALLGKMKA